MFSWLYPSLKVTARAGITTHDPQFQKKEPLVPDGAAAYMRASSKKLEPVGDE
jgi:hypothetical protein